MFGNSGLSGVITSDPFEILQAEKEFYESLYKSRVYAQQTKASFNYNDLPIPKVQKTVNSLVKELLP